MTEAEIDIRLREEFSKVCFETLLQFSFSNKVTTPQEGYISRMALSVLLKRSQDVLHRYIEDERLSGKCPLPRYVFPLGNKGYYQYRLSWLHSEYVCCVLEVFMYMGVS